MAGERLLARLDRLDHLVGQVALVRAALEQHRSLAHRQLAGPAQGARELRGRLAVRAQPRRVLAGHGRVPQHRGGVAGRLGVVGEPRRVGAARVEPLEHLAVQRRAAPRRDLGLEREPRELVAEGDGAAVHPRHAGQQAFVERLVGGVDQLRVGGAGDHGQALEQLARRRAQTGGAGEHGVADRGRDRGGGRGQHLGHVERVAAGAAVQGVGVDPVRLGQRADRLGGQRRQLDPLDAHGGGQLAEHHAQRPRLVVAEGDERERGHALHPAPEQAQHVERALVGPVDVLEHEHGAGRLAQGVQQGGDEHGRPRAGRDDLLQLAAGGVGDVEQRAERPRRVQRVARAPQDLAALGELAHERGLADAGLAADQDQPAGRAGEHVEKRLAL